MCLFLSRHFFVLIFRLAQHAVAYISDSVWEDIAPSSLFSVFTFLKVSKMNAEAERRLDSRVRWILRIWPTS